MSPLLTQIAAMLAPQAAAQLSPFDKMVREYQGTPLPQMNGQTPPIAPTEDERAMAQAPEAPQVSAPMPDGGPSTAMPATEAPRLSKKRGGILGALESVFMPEADSRWRSALNNGIWNAKAGQDAYRQEQAAGVVKSQQAQVDLATSRAKAARGELITTPNGAVLRPNEAGDGVTQLYTPPVKPTETESLIDKWEAARASGDQKRMELLERAIKGYQYTPEVIDRQIAGRAAVKRTVPGKAPSAPAKGRAAPSGSKLPTGFVLD